MPRLLTPAGIAALPRGYPLGACACDQCQENWRELSLPSATAVALFPNSWIPGEHQINDLSTGARGWVEEQARTEQERTGVAFSDFRAKLRFVNTRAASTYFTDRAIYTRNQRHSDGRGNQVRITPPRVQMSQPRFVTATVLWDGAQPNQRVSVGLPLPPDVPPQAGPSADWHTEPGANPRRAIRFANSPTATPVPGPRDPLPDSTYRDSPMEEPLALAQRAALESPLRRILEKGGRVWSAEVEVDHISPREAARVLGVEQGQYSIRPDEPSVVAASDSSVDAEIKISCMRDGSPAHAALATSTYRTLFANQARARLNTGHHVHIDGTRLADLGADTTLDVLLAASRIGHVTSAAMRALCASGYARHRGYGGAGTFRTDRDNIQTKGPAIHGQRVVGAARDNMRLRYSGATMEFRMPNGTLEPVRAHAYVALGAALLDVAERAVLDGEPAAVEALRLADDRLGHASPFAQPLATQFILDHLRMSEDSLLALAITGWTASLLEAPSRLLLVERIGRVPGTGVFLSSEQFGEIEREQDHAQALIEEQMRAAEQAPAFSSPHDQHVALDEGHFTSPASVQSRAEWAQPTTDESW